MAGTPKVVSPAQEYMRCLIDTDHTTTKINKMVSDLVFTHCESMNQILSEYQTEHLYKCVRLSDIEFTIERIGHPTYKLMHVVKDGRWNTWCSELKITGPETEHRIPILGNLDVYCNIGFPSDWYEILAKLMFCP